MSKNWFVIHARSGYEAKVKLAIEEAVIREGGRTVGAGVVSKITN